MLFLFINFCILFSYISCKAISSDVYPPPPPTFKASDYTTFDNNDINGSKRGLINVSYINSDGNNDYIKIIRLDLIGNSHERGFAHGALLAHEIVRFYGPEMEKYYIKNYKDFDVTRLPIAMQNIIKNLPFEGDFAGALVLRTSMSLVYEHEKKYIPQRLIDEMDGIAEGMCSTLGQDCDVEMWKKQIKQLNMFPELIRMACTALGAWGPATENNHMLQLRALDFGGGPWGNNTIMYVHKNDPTNPDHAFVSIFFPGMVGVITGVAQNGIGVSEKVWMVYDTPSNLQPGSFEGEADVMVLRDILELSSSRKDAEKYLQNVNRTWAIWIGVGDKDQFDLVGYEENSAIVYDDVTMPNMTGQPYINSVCYVDKHPQPSHDNPNGTLPTVLTDFYGDISLETMKQIVQFHETGDAHVASYDFTSNQMMLAIGKTNMYGEYGNDCEWAAWNRPWLLFDLENLWK